MVPLCNSPREVIRLANLNVVAILLSCWLQASEFYLAEAARSSISSKQPSRSFPSEEFSRDQKFVNRWEKVTGLRGELMHPDHVDSPVRNVEAVTDLARTRNDVFQTAAREEVLNQRLSRMKIRAPGEGLNEWLARMQNKAPGEGSRVGRKALGTLSIGEKSGVDNWGNNPIRMPTQDVQGITPRSGGYESSVSLTGGGYSMTISIGTPPRKFTAFADTGSDLPWIQCSPCESCFMQNEEFFDPSTSSSYQPIACTSKVCDMLEQEQNFAGCKPRCSGSSGGCTPTCQYEYEYGDQTHSNGDMATESLTLSRAGGDGGALTVSKFVFGCGHDNSGSLNQTGASGIIGLGRGDLSLLNQLKPYMSAKFSTCLVHRTTAVTTTSTILFGEVAASISSSLPGIQYTPIVSGNNSVESFYYVNVEGISVGDRRIIIPDQAKVFSIDSATGQGGTILDSGSTLTSLVPRLYSLVMDEFVLQAPGYPRVDFSSHGLDLCFAVTDAKTKPTHQLPSITFHLTGANWTMPHENIGFEISDGAGGMVVCVALTKSTYGTNIIGNFQQQNFHILYDLENDQIGFAKTRCDNQ